MADERREWEALFRDVGEYVAPRRESMLDREGRPRPDDEARSRRTRIINQTPTIALRTLVNGLFSGIVDPSDRWFRIEPQDKSLLEIGPVALWFDDVEQTLYDILAGSGFYAAMTIVLRELAAYGTAAVLQLEDFDRVNRFEPWLIGQYVAAADAAGRVHRACRTVDMTAEEMVEAFGRDAVGDNVRAAFDAGRLADRFRVHYLLEPGEWWHDQGLLPAHFPVAAVHWQDGSDRLLRVGGFREMPLHVVRWEPTSGFAWGYGPGIQALGDAKQLQALERDKLKAIQKVVDPPLQGPAVFAIDEDAGRPGHFTPTPTADPNAGLRPVYQINPDLGAIMQEIRTVERRLLELFYADLFLQMTLSDRRQITAREVDERVAEKVQMLGPVISGLSRELLDPIITRLFAMLVRASRPLWPAAGILPPPPAEIAGQEMAIRYISPLHHAQRAARVNAVGRFVQFVSGLAALDSDALLKLDGAAAVDEMAQMLGVGPRVVRSDQDVEALRAARRQQQEAAAQLQQAQAAADVAQKIAPVVGT